MAAADSDYTSTEYWDERYSTSESPYEWSVLCLRLTCRVLDYSSLKDYDIERFVKKSDTILFLGCGDSCNRYTALSFD